MALRSLHRVIKKFLFEVMLFLFLQAILMFVLAILVLLYPYTLNLLVALAFFVTGLISVYIMIRVGMLAHEVAKIKKLLGK